jgi:hypothetical protein
MADILLDYTFSVSPSTLIPLVSAAYIRQVLVIVKPLKSADKSVGGGATLGTSASNSGGGAGKVEDVKISKCTKKEALAQLTKDEDIGELFNAGMTSVYVLATDSLTGTERLVESSKDFFTVLISDDFDVNDVKTFKRGRFRGVIGRSFSDVEEAKKFSVEEKQCGFYGTKGMGAKNMFRAFGKLLSHTVWRNHQYERMPYSDGITELGVAKGLFNDRVSFVLTSEGYGSRLAFFVAGKQAITAPYIYENLTLDAQSAALQYIAANNPNYTLTEASLLENALQSVLERNYVATRLVKSAKVSITLDEGNNFRASGTIVVPEPKALWGIDVELVQGQ